MCVAHAVCCLLLHEQMGEIHMSVNFFEVTHIHFFGHWGAVKLAEHTSVLIYSHFREIYFNTQFIHKLKCNRGPPPLIILDLAVASPSLNKINKYILLYFSTWIHFICL